MGTQTTVNGVHKSVRRATDCTFRAQQRNRREAVQLKTKQEELDREKVKIRYLAGKKKRQIESGVTQLFTTSGHSPAALPPEGPDDTQYENSPYFSKGALTKLGEKRLLKWRRRERQYEREKQEEGEVLSPWARTEKTEETQRVMNQLSWILQSGFQGKKPTSDTLKPNEPADNADETDNCLFKKVEGKLQDRAIHNTVVDVFEKLKLDIDKKNEAKNLPNYIGMNKQENLFTLKEWEKCTTEDYTSFITRPMKSTKTQIRPTSASEMNHRSVSAPKYQDDKVKSVVPAQSHSLKYLEKYDPEAVDKRSQNQYTRNIRPISAQSPFPFVPINHKCKRKRIKSAETVPLNHRESHLTSNLEVVKKDQQTVPKPELVISPIKVPRESDEMIQEWQSDLSCEDFVSEDQFIAKGVQEMTSSEKLLNPSDKSRSNSSPASKDVKSSKVVQKNKNKLGSLKMKRKAKRPPVPTECREQLNSRTTAKKKFVTKIKELAELYEDELNESDKDDELKDEASGLSERMSQWRRDLMREAPPSIYSVNAPVKIHLAVSKSQLQKDLGRLVDEHSSDFRLLNDKEHARRLKSRMNVYMTMKVIEKAVTDSKIKQS